MNDAAAARLLGSLLAAAAVTYGLFLLMSRLVGTDALVGLETPPPLLVDFIRVERDEQTPPERRPPPPEPEKTEPLPPTIRKLTFNKPAAALPGLDANLARSLDIRTDLSGFAVGDGGTPLVRVSPVYPLRASSRGIEGWVEIEFTIAADGRVVAPRVVESEPPAVFDRAALRAVSRWRYRPPVQDGRPVRRDGVRVVIEFQLER